MTDARVLATQVRYDSTVFGDDFVPVVRFQYQINGKYYESEKIWLYDTGMPKNQAEQVIAQYTPGSLVRVYYNAERIQEGVLYPGLYQEAPRRDMIVFGGLILSGFWLLFFMLNRSEKKYQQPR